MPIGNGCDAVEQSQWDKAVAKMAGSTPELLAWVGFQLLLRVPHAGGEAGQQSLLIIAWEAKLSFPLEMKDLRN